MPDNFNKVRNYLLNCKLEKVESKEYTTIHNKGTTDLF
ncbi:unnamed protein product [Paramecium sonneborni]|uniref:Uncharacterized protein n=1 Tax=Paramecium sonneborni TaxID=65129 RepID=A0A8S1L870_9CILI|nr:unnamed protein product [Paramecium sonneborni]